MPQHPLPPGPSLPYCSTFCYDPAVLSISIHFISWLYVLDADIQPASSGLSEKRHFLEGVRVCIKAWCKVYGIARSWYVLQLSDSLTVLANNIWKRNPFDEVRFVVSEKLKLLNRPFDYCCCCFSWNSYFEGAKKDIWRNRRRGNKRGIEEHCFQLHCWLDAQVCNERRQHANQWHVKPSSLPKDSVFRIYQEEMTKKNRPCLAKSTFLYNMWKERNNSRMSSSQRLEC